MLKDLTRDDWLGMLGLPAERVPPVLILRGTRNLRANYERYHRYFTDIEELGSPNALFEDVFIGRHGGLDVGYASVYGPAMASEITHVFGVMGTRLVIQTGVCGALGDDIAPGGLGIATRARCAEGAAACYLPDVDDVDASASLVNVVVDEAAGTISVPCHTGPVWTTAALLAEGQAEIDDWHGQGYIAADMETATTFAVAEYFGMERLSILSTFDNPRQGAHLGLIEAHKDAARAAGEAAMIALVFTLLDRVSADQSQLRDNTFVHPA